MSAVTMSNMHKAQHTSFAGAFQLPALQRASNSERAQESRLQATRLLKGCQAATLCANTVHHVQLTVPQLQACPCRLQERGASCPPCTSHSALPAGPPCDILCSWHRCQGS